MLYGAAEDTEPVKGDAGIVQEAVERWKACKDWQGTQDERIREDIKFANGDSRNAWQWPANIYQSRTGDGSDLPCLTINNTRVHNDLIINSLSKNGYGIRIRPTGGKASYASAEIMQSVIRRIEYISKASSAYRKVAEQQVDGGIGYILIETAYVSSRTRNQEIYLKASRDPTGVYLDPWIRETDGSDANFGFVFERMPRKEFNRKYPRYKNKVGTAPLDNGFADWISDKEIMLAKYFRKKEKRDRLIWFKQDSGDEIEKLASEIRKESGEELYKKLMEDIEAGKLEGGSRSVLDDKVEWFLIAGDTVIERGDWAGKYIPICRCVGRELVIDGTLDLKGHTRPLIDANRMLNYNAPLALDTRIPTPTGWTTIGAIRAGDLVFDENGKPCRVLGESSVFRERQCFRVKFSNGTEIVADGGHLWSVEERGKRNSRGQNWSNRVIATADLVRSKHFIKLSPSLETSEVHLPIDPYVFGLWLGDGTSREPQITSCIQDIDETRKNIEDCGYDLSTSKLYNGGTVGRFTICDIRGKLTALGVRGQNRKKIPAIYLRGSTSQRLSLLQGLMDTDGHFAKSVNQCSFSNKNPKLIEGILELLRSLGIKATCSEQKAARKTFPNGKEYTSGITYRVSFTADPDTPVFKLARKRKAQSKARGTEWRRTKRVGIVSVEEIPSVPVKCIGVDTPNHLFLAGNGMIPTHNSMAVEIVALQPKSPFMAPARAIEGQEQYKTINILGYPVILYNDLDDEAEGEAQKIAAPFRLDPPKPSVAHERGMQTAERHSMMISGQFENQMGEAKPDAAASGKAITERKAQGDTATYHFVEHFSDMLRHIGVQLLDLIPNIYDTERTLHILDEDGEKRWIKIDPNQEEAVRELEHEKEDEEAVQLAFNPAIGEYECVSDPGPDYATQRQQGWDAMERMLQGNNELITVAGDLLFKYGDFPGADKIQERLQKEIKANKPYLFDEDVNPQLQAVQEQNKRLIALNSELMQKIAEMHLSMKGREEKRDVDAFNAETNRMKAQIDALSKLLLTPQQKAQMEHEIEARGHEHVYNLVEQANQADLSADTDDDAGAANGQGSPSNGQQSPGGQLQGNEQPPMDGARQAKDGMWYIPDRMPGREGKFLRVVQ
jgi:hypothetical protein